MAAYPDDEEQIEMLKRWWQDYGKYLAIAVVVGVVVGFGWRGWQRHQSEQALQASILYQRVLVADARVDRDSAQKYAHQLVTKHAKTPYAVMANLILAKEAVENNQLDAALKQLHWIIEHGHNPSFRQIARIRAARILLAQQEAQDALKLLAKVDDERFQPEIDMVQGDIYFAIGQGKKAKKAYSAAQQLLAAQGGNDPILKMKLSQSFPEPAKKSVANSDEHHSKLQSSTSGTVTQ